MTFSTVYQFAEKRILGLIDFICRGTSLAEWAQFGAVLATGLICILIVRLFLKGVLKRLARRISWLNADRLVAGACFFAVSLLALYFLNRALDVFKKMPGWLWQWKHDIIPWVYGALFFIFAMKAIDLVVDALRKIWQRNQAGVDDSVAILLGRTIKVILLILVGMVVLDNLGIKIIGLITGLGFIGAALALASQNTIANTIGYFEILFDRLFKVGDMIAFAEHQGFVTAIGLRSVQIRALTGELINVPNKDLVDKKIRNFTRKHAHRVALQVGIIYNSNRALVEQAMDILKEVASHMPGVEHYQVSFDQLGASALELSVSFWVPFENQREYREILTQTNLAVKEAFDRAGIEFAFPTQTLHLQQSLQSPEAKGP